jgi:radical SAM-linked protein
MKVQRLRVTFGRGEEIKYITHLDLMRFWERALRRAGLPVAYSEGFSPHAQLALAAPLPVGTTGDAELMDVFLAERIAPKTFIEEASKQLPAAMTIISVEETGMALPALQADVRFAEYEVGLAPGASADDARAAVDAFLAAETFPWEHKRDDEVRSYDIRAQVESIDVAQQADGPVRLLMRLKNDNTGSGRPEQVVAALGLGTPVRIHRTKLVLAGTSPSREAWRKSGRFAG